MKAKFDDGDDDGMLQIVTSVVWWEKEDYEKKEVVGLCVCVCGMDDGELFLLSFCVPRSLVWAADHY
jgi:hypothetical protein